MSFLTKRVSPITIPTTGSIANKVLALTNSAIIEITRTNENKYSLDDYINMIDRDPVVSSNVELKALRATIAIGNYENSDKKIQATIRKNFELMDGSLPQIVGQLSHAMPLGFSVAEIIFQTTYAKQWTLKGINVLDPRKVSFKGAKGKITHVIYNDGSGPKKEIPYNKCVHVVNGFTTNFNDPFGTPECRRAYPYYKAKQAIMAELTIAAKNNATGIWVGFSNSNNRVQLFGADGTPLYDYEKNPIILSGTESLLRQLQNIDNSSVIVTDKENSIETRQLNSGEQFWNFAINILDNQINRAFSIPNLVFNEGSGSFNSSVSVQHKNVLDATVESIVLQIKDQLIEKVCKPLIVLNSGPKDNYGDFAELIERDAQTKSALLQNFVTASSMGLIDANDPEVKAKVRDLLDLPELSEDEKKELKEAQELLKAANFVNNDTNPDVGESY